MLYLVEEFGAERFFDVYISFLPAAGAELEDEATVARPSATTSMPRSSARREHMQQAVAAR